MKAHIYTIEDEYMGIPLLIEGELIDYEDQEPPFIVIQEITFKDRPLEFWCISEAFIKHCQNRIFQTWCSESHQNGARSC
jgi:hypothetical protein